MTRTNSRQRAAVRRPGGWLVAVGLAGAALAQAAEPGIYADFETSLGNFTCRLEPTHAPKAVANFIGLATGERAWVDEPTGAVRAEPFFNGLAFHRVIQGFMLQGGSPNGQGDDGPGYVFTDEFTPELRHDAAGVLSLANSGPSSNGAQFFVTVAPTPWLNDIHTVFGKVVEGMEVVTAISEVDTDDDDRPKTPVVVTRIAIRREGDAAEAFGIAAQGLPVVTPGDLTIAATPGQVQLDFPGDVRVETFLRKAGALGQWSSRSLGIDLSGPPLSRIEQAADGAAGFFALSQVRYAESTRAPRDLAGRELGIQLFGGAQLLTVQFDAEGGGAYVYNDEAGTVTSYTWSQEPYRGRLRPIEFSAVVPMALRLDFTSETAGSYSGTAYATPPFEITGTFTLSAP